ncbi:MAG: DUF599 domain-containing protein [Burkholderiales bacterium]|nr:DUF599 domain-containing protein [Burkholderiales bacterium]
MNIREYLTLGQTLTPHDLVAVAFFLGAWVGYSRFAVWHGRRAASLQGVLDGLRATWAARMVERDNRMVDINIVRNLTRSSQFFASTTLLILGALIALLGYVQRAADVVSELPFAIQASNRLWDIKILLLVGVFVYAFFKFSWSIRQFGFCSIVVGAVPQPPKDARECAGEIASVSLLVSFASGNFNQGLRSYYFAMAALSWFLHPWLMIATTLWVVWVLYAREFRSRTLDVLRGGGIEIASVRESRRRWR